MTARSYGDGCAAAHALDLVGERWALLVVRELLLGPKRFTDLRTGMPTASPNVLSQRLRELEQAGLVRHRRMGPPVSSSVYELTDWGLMLEPVLLELGRWGRCSPQFSGETEASVDALMLALRGRFDPALAGDLSSSVALNINDDHFVARVADQRLTLQRGTAARPDASLTTDGATFAALMTKRIDLRKAVAARRAELTGAVEAVRRLLNSLATPTPAAAEFAAG